MRFAPCLASVACGSLVLACTVNNNTTNAGPDAGGGTDGPVTTGSDAGGQGPLPFTPSNVSLAGIDLSHLGDEDVASDCTIKTGDGDAEDCFQSAAEATVVQSDMSQVHLLVVKSLKIEPTAHLTVTGGSPLVVVSLGDLSVLGAILANAQGDSGGAGGFSGMHDVSGAGPGGGAVAVGMTGTPGAGAGGASYCGQGGQGSVEMGASATPGAKAAVYGSPQIVPLVGGSAGGGGDVGGAGGGGAVQLVAGGALTLGAGGSVDVSGGGGVFGGTTGQEAGGGGSGGSILLEATSVTVAGVLVANGGGGGGGGAGAARGEDGTANASPAAGGAGAEGGGQGAAGALIDGQSAPVTTATGSAGGGGGAAGRIRINSKSGVAAIAAGTLSPSTATSCVSQGTVR
jgi:hypothetical protein